MAMSKEKDTTVWITVDGKDYHKEKSDYKVWWLDDREIVGRPCFILTSKHFFISIEIIHKT